MDNQRNFNFDKYHLSIHADKWQRDQKKYFKRYLNKLSKLKTLSKKCTPKMNFQSANKTHEKRGKLLNPLYRTHPVVTSLTQLR